MTSSSLPVPRVERLLAVIELQNALLASRLEVADVLQTVVDRALSMTAATGAVLELAEGEEYLVYKAVAGSPATLASLGVRVSRAGSLSGLCVRERRPLTCDDASCDPRVDAEAVRRVGVASMICVPLFLDAAAVGVLKVLSDRLAAFTEEDLATLQLFATIVGVSMHHASRYAETRHQSLHDVLTGLPNRRAFEEALGREVGRHRRFSRALSLAFFDLDGFKAANDRFGHAAGDDVLRQVADLLRTTTREVDSCFRLGGDEFAILMPDTSEAGAAVAVKRACDAIHAASIMAGTVGVSSGYATAAGESPEELCRLADAALYATKRARKQPQ